MRDLETRRAIYTKAALFLVLGAGAATLVVLQSPTMKAGLLLAIAVTSVGEARVWCRIVPSQVHGYAEIRICVLG